MLEQEGLRVIRFTNAEVLSQFEEVCGEILKMLRSGKVP